MSHLVLYQNIGKITNTGIKNITITYIAAAIATHQWLGGSVAEWLACRTQARKSTGSNRSRDAVE